MPEPVDGFYSLNPVLWAIKKNRSAFDRIVKKSHIVAEDANGTGARQTGRIRSTRNRTPMDTWQQGRGRHGVFRQQPPVVYNLSRRCDRGVLSDRSIVRSCAVSNT
jgi:hypothetical protein